MRPLRGSLVRSRAPRARIAEHDRNATVCNVARARSTAGFWFFALVASVCTACGASAVRAPERPEPIVEMRIPPRRAPRELPRLIAPPPAYGNKIVMAHADASTITN